MELLSSRILALPLTPDPLATIGRADTRLRGFVFFEGGRGGHGHLHAPRNPFGFYFDRVVNYQSSVPRDIYPLLTVQVN